MVGTHLAASKKTPCLLLPDLSGAVSKPQPTGGFRVLSGPAVSEAGQSQRAGSAREKASSQGLVVWLS